MKNRPTADAINRNSVNEVRFSGRLTGADGASKEAQGVGLYIGEAHPANVDANAAGLAHWHQCYGALWKLKIAFEKEHNR